MWGSRTKGKSGLSFPSGVRSDVSDIQLGRCATAAISTVAAARDSAKFQYDRRVPELRQGKAPRRAGRAGESLVALANID